MVIHHDNDGGGEYKNIRTKIVVRFQGIILVRSPKLQYTCAKDSWNDRNEYRAR